MENHTTTFTDEIICENSMEMHELFRHALQSITGKWKSMIIWNLVRRTMRFGELRRAVPGITQHMLTQQLRELEADGLIKRTQYAEIPLRVEYEATEAVLALRPVFKEIAIWAKRYSVLFQSEVVDAAE